MATLLLVENSQAVLPMWPDLRDRYLQLLVAKLESRTRGAQVSSFLQMFVISYYPAIARKLLSLPCKISLPDMRANHLSLDSILRFNEGCAK